MEGENYLPGEPFLDACPNIPDQVVNHAVDGSIDLCEFVNQLIHRLLWFTSIDPCVRKKDDDQEHDENNDQDCF